MSGLLIFEDHAWRQFLPLTYWRAVFQLACGRRTLAERCQETLNLELAGWWVRAELAALTAARSRAPVNQPLQPDVLLANGRWIPLGDEQPLPRPGVGMIDDTVACVRCDARLAEGLTPQDVADPDRLAERLDGVPRLPVRGIVLHYPWDLLTNHRELLLADWDPSSAGVHGTLHPGVHRINESHLHVGADTVVRAGAVLDAQDGPIFVGKRVTVHSNVVIQGPVCVADDAVVNAGAWIRQQVSIGPGAKVGGEISNSVIMARSNKQHHGFCGDSVVGTWVNLGAGTTTSNLKNTYGEISVPVCGAAVPTRRRFMGALIGDYAKIGIDQSLTTGCVIGFGSSIAGRRSNAPFTPSFRFVTEQQDQPYEPQRCLEVARRTMARRNRDMLDVERDWFLTLPPIAASCESL